MPDKKPVTSAEKSSSTTAPGYWIRLLSSDASPEGEQRRRRFLMAAGNSPQDAALGAGDAKSFLGKLPDLDTPGTEERWRTLLEQSRDPGPQSSGDWAPERDIVPTENWTGKGGKINRAIDRVYDWLYR